MERRKTKKVKVGDIEIGGGSPISVQGMTKTATEDVESTVKEIRRLKSKGAEIVRVGIPDLYSAQAIEEIRKKVDVPLIADIHFDYRLALICLEKGVDAIRLNPVNIFKFEQIKKIVEKAKAQKAVIRIGVNAGSIAVSSSEEKGNQGIAEIMVEKALDYLRILENLEFYDIIISLKSSEVRSTIQAYRLMARKCDYPFHLGVTATGFATTGLIKSAIGIGTLLAEGIGDTLRVSLTDKPENEIEVAKEILQSLGLRRFKPEIISCPTCARTSVDLKRIVREVKRRLEGMDKDFPYQKIAVMGCVVNGPGEAREADIGVSFAGGEGVIFKKGRIIRRVPEKDVVEILFKEMEWECR
ncbi:MAG: 4-hydroxy-3-methylbut-2-en-1-yl diphosphate synthase [Candidatus Omnitrophota bacterium]|nr:MAG: 4-hydroxy-3-methylbut-2-en-1-yl diphosphate synthase [Candidatus Omnitrophota bacterium]